MQVAEPCFELGSEFSYLLTEFILAFGSSESKPEFKFRSSVESAKRIHYEQQNPA